jgi:hypothetical protein
MRNLSESNVHAYETAESMISLSVDCVKCKTMLSPPLNITKEQYHELRKDALERDFIQSILPGVEPEIREYFISGLCPKCFVEQDGPDTEPTERTVDPLTRDEEPEEEENGE